MASHFLQDEILCIPYEAPHGLNFACHTSLISHCGFCAPHRHNISAKQPIQPLYSHLAFVSQLSLPEMISICSGYCPHAQVVISDHFSKMPFLISPSSLPMVLELFCTLESPENSKAQEVRPSFSFFLNSPGV